MSCGVVLETLGALATDAAALARWRVLVEQLGLGLGWPMLQPSIKCCSNTSIVAFHAPVDLLMLATEINEWAWEMAVGLIGQAAPHPDYQQFDALHAAYPDLASAIEVFSNRASCQARPDIVALLQRAARLQLPVLIDDDHLTLGSGTGARTWPLLALPQVDDVPWSQLHAVPAVTVSGTNGKTTSVRLLAAIAAQAGKRVGHCCTDGVFIHGQALAAGDYSGPAGARTVLRDSRVEFAVLEVARGGILRRGLALDRADVALLTNVSPEHYGEYGVENLQDLADVKLVLAQALGTQGYLVINADDAVLLERAQQCRAQLALFALDYAHPALQAQRARGAPCCGVDAGQLRLFVDAQEYDVGTVKALPLTLAGTALYNIANCAGAALAAALSGIAVPHIQTVLAQFGASRFDNPGRLERWELAGTNVLLDYAHNPEGLQGLLKVAQGLQNLRGSGRLGLLLGQAGNRSDAAIADLAAMAASFPLEHIILKDMQEYLRGRQAGEVPALLQAQLIKSGVAGSKIRTVLSEVAAAQALLAWAQSGDVLVLPVHDKASKAQLRELLDSLQAQGWQAGQPLPDIGLEKNQNSESK